jgi:hypothetical protein
MVLRPGNERFASNLWQHSLLQRRHCAGWIASPPARNAGSYTGMTSELSMSSVS